MKKKRAKMGRPPLPKAVRRDIIVSIACTRAERARMKAAAKAEGISVSELLSRPFRDDKQGGERGEA